MTKRFAVPDRVEVSDVTIAGRDVVAVDYRRVPPWNPLRDAPPGPLPGIRYPVPLGDVTDAFTWLRDARPDGRVVLGGASAGACLSAAATVRMRDAGTAMPVG